MFILDSSKFMQLPFDKGKWINYIINLECKLKDYFKVLKDKKNISEKEFDSIFPVETMPNILKGNPKVLKQLLRAL